MKVISVTDFDLASKTLRDNDLRQALYDEGAVIMDKVLVNLHGDEHKTRRNVENKIFRRDFFKYYEHEVFPQTLQETLAPFVAKKKLDLVDFGYRVMLNLTADFSGIDRPKRTPEETESLLAYVKRFAQGATLVHSTLDREEVRADVRHKLSAFQGEFLQGSIDRRLALLKDLEAGEITQDDLPRDVLMILLQNEDKVDLPPDVLCREIAFFMLAGAFTSIHSMSHAMHEIFTWCTAHPEDWEKAHNDRLFLQRCVHESTRLHPSSPTANRRPACPVHHFEGDDLKVEDEVHVNILEANKDTKIFGPDAAQFNPYREIPQGQTPFGLSFGLGMHSCIGRNLAGGVVPKGNTDPATHHYGTVTLIVKELLDHGARPDPDDAPRMDETTERPNWGYYPVILGGR